MPLPTNLLLSHKELALVTDADVIYTKEAILEKASQLLALQVTVIDKLFLFPGSPLENIAFLSPKISKGERYLGLPYLILDHPRLFKGNDIFAVRTMFWWGKHLSVTLHLGGAWYEAFGNFSGISIEGLYLSISHDQWHHHFDTDNYQLISLINRDSAQSLSEQRSFVKLAVRIELEKWNQAETELEAAYNRLAAVILASKPVK